MCGTRERSGTATAEHRGSELRVTRGRVMAGVLAEMQWGRHKTHLSFTGITVCTTLTCVMSAGKRLLGAHFSLQKETLEYDAVFTGMKSLIGNGESILAMYIVRVQDTWGEPKFKAGILKDKRLIANAQAATFKDQLGYTGAVKVLEVTGNNYGSGAAKGGNIVSTTWQEAKGRVKIQVDGMTMNDYFKTA